jgi:hypothetical protein
LTVNGKDYTQELAVLKDPHSTGSEADIQSQMTTLMEIRDNMNTVVDMINQIERTRDQIYKLNDLLEGSTDSESLINAGKELDKKLIELEDHLIQMKLTGGNAGQDTLRWPAKLNTKLSTLANGIGSSDFPPTTQQMEVHRLFSEQIEAHKSRMDELLSKDLAAYNRMLGEKKIDHIIVLEKP